MEKLAIAFGGAILIALFVVCLVIFGTLFGDRRADARHKWVKFPEGGVLQMNAGGVAWQMARDKGMI